jgi:hypothetical protein
LNGSYKIVPDSVSGEQTGWWSDSLSDENGDFSSPPTLTFNFTEDHSSIGFTIYFDDKTGEIPTNLTASAYDSTDTLIDETTIDNDAVKCVIELQVENYRKVIFQFNKSNPYRRIRVAEVAFGIIQDFDESNIKSASMLYEVSPTAEYLPSNELRLVIDNTDQKYNMGSPSSVYDFLQTGQPILSELGVGERKDDIEYVNTGIYYFTRSQAEDNSMTAEIVSNDRLFQLGKTICKIGTTGTWTVSDAVTAVIADSGVDIPVVMPAEIGARVIGKAIPSDATHREALRLIAQAGQSTCFINRDDELQFVEVTVGTPVDSLDNDNLSKYAQPFVSDRVNTVALTAYDEYAEIETVYTAQNLGTYETPQVFSFDNPLGTQATADWMLAMKQMRRTYDLYERGNPARELTDTVTVTDKFGNVADTVITSEQYEFDGTLSAISRGVN